MDVELQTFLERAQAAQKQACLVPDKRPVCRPAKQLPLWPKSDRAAPSSILRSSLFRVYKRGNQGSMKEQKVASWDTESVEYTGFELGQHHLDIWLQLVHMSSQQGRSRITGFTVQGILKSLGRSYGRTDYQWLENVMKELHLGAITITKMTNKGKIIAGVHLLDHYVLTPGQCCVEMNAQIAEWFTLDEYTRLHWETRLALKGNLTRWLHGYICSHQATLKNPSKIGLEKLRDLCGSERKEIRFFRRDLYKSMSQLEKIGEVSAWSIDDDVLSFARPPKRKALT